MKILIPLDGSEVGEAVIPRVLEMIFRINCEKQCKVILFHVITEQLPNQIMYSGTSVDILVPEKEMKLNKKKAISYLTKVGESIKAKGIAVTSKTAISDSPAGEIVIAAEEEKVDMIAMSTHGRSGIGRWALGSVTDKTLHLETNIPKLVIRARAK